MEYISSDTNVWIDFVVIGHLEFPFRLPYVYLMNKDLAEDELLNPPELGNILVELGLRKIAISETEFFLAEEYAMKYVRLSLHDQIALAIARAREITLLTGDGSLRKAAYTEGVAVTGTLGIFDQLRDGVHITGEEYRDCILRLSAHNGGKVRLPKEELKKRLISDK